MPATLPWLHRFAFLALAAALLRRGGSGFDLAVALGLALLAFDPGWIPGRAPSGPGARQAAGTLFYDGSCGLCHASVRFFIAEDPAGRLRFGTLQGGSFRRALGPKDRAALPDSLVLVTSDDRVLTRARGVRHGLAAIGGYWRLLAAIAGIVPVRVADAAYDLVARARHRLFRRPPEACPLIPKELRGRFLD